METLKFEQSEKKRAFDEWLQTEQLNLSKSKANGSAKDTDAEKRTENYADFMEDAQGFKQEVAAGNMAYDNAYYALSQTYPWMNEKDVKSALGMKHDYGNYTEVEDVGYAPAQQGFTIKGGGLFNKIKSSVSSYLDDAKITRDSQGKVNARGEKPVK